jgi:DNA mismatch endonuclease, patch repair protein
MPDNLTKEQRSHNMARIRGRDTGPELELRRALWAAGLRGYRVDARKLPGRPDVAWFWAKLAVFADGAFWHGHPSAYWPGKSSAYWDAKIQRNLERDRLVDSALKELGWEVRRFWDFEILEDPRHCAEEVRALLNRQA